MAGLIIVCSREGYTLGDVATDVRRCAALIAPANVTAREPVLWEVDGFVSALVTPGPAPLFRNGSVGVGHLYEPHERWWEPGSPPPDGAYALCRVDDRHVELVADLYASRTLWYAKTKTLFVASSSQRAVVALLGSFELNYEAVSWMLSAGYLPPGAGWDARLRRVPPAGRLTLDRRRWTYNEVTDPVPISPAPGTEKEHIDLLRAAVMDACARLDLPLKNWRLALSGGMDSRGIAVGLVRAGGRPTCITWGLDAARSDRKNDAVIARLVADRLGLPHVYYSTDFTDEPLDRVFGRFLSTSEGRLDSFDAYTDGLRMWRSLVESGVEGIIRGDEAVHGFRWYFPSELQVRLRGFAHLVRDYPPAHPIHRLELAHQTWPEELHRRADESLCSYAGRLFQDFGSPAMASPLNDLKGLYMEVANPLLSRGVVTAAHTLPESLRRGRLGNKALHASLSIGVPFAEHSAPAARSVYLEHPGVRDELQRGLTSPPAHRLFPDKAAATLVALLRETPNASLWGRVRPRIKEAVPSRMSERLKPLPQLTGQGARLAFRAYIAVRTAELLATDAQALAAVIRG